MHVNSVEEMPAPKVTVLLPTYNTEKYLAQNLDALVGQTLRDIEIIAINDGSTDGSLDIMRQYAVRDARIRIIDKPNSGYGASLNLGIDEARGEYIAISEPDDYIERTLLAKMYKAGKKREADLVKCNYFEHFDTHENKHKNLAGYPYGRVFDAADQPQIIRTVPSIWTGLYRRDWLNAEGIRFRETPGASFQDTAFVMKSWFAARRVVLLRRCLVHYRMDNPNSSVKTSNKVFEVCDELAESQQFLRQRPARYKAFIPWFHVDKWGKYQWNYERISPELHASFAQRAKAEYAEAQAAGELDMSLFAPEAAAQLADLLALDPAQFAQKYSTLV